LLGFCGGKFIESNRSNSYVYEEISLAITYICVLKYFMMKIFISHSSKNSKFGQAIVDLLLSVGVSSNQIIFTSNDAFGIPNGKNIFNWLKERITEKPHVIYLLSPEYYSSIACLNEMGAAWIIENQHTIIFTPQFNPSSPEFQNGALDPREMGFKINNVDRITEFVESLKQYNTISSNPVLINQKIRKFIEDVNNIESQNIINSTTNRSRDLNISDIEKLESNLIEEPLKKSVVLKTESNQVNKFLKDLQEDKLKDEEILLLHYVIDTARYKLGVGWKSTGEIENIRVWEDVNSLNSKLSTSYDDIMRRYEFKKLTEVSEFTSSGNPREVILIPDLRELLLDLPTDTLSQITKVADKNPKIISSSSRNFGWVEDEEGEKEDLPF